MENKQTIIDGVDVSGCECIIEDYQQANNFKGGYEHIKNVCELGERGAENYNLFCKDNPNCYYKQLKRKEQECNKLYIQLKADEEYHKEEENILRKIIKNKEGINIELYKENNKLKQTLAEIEEIAKYNNFLVRDPFCGTGYRDLSGQILNIIKRAKEK